MSSLEQRKRLKAYYQRTNALFAEWRERGYRYPPPRSEPMPGDLRRLQCGAKTKAGTACKQIAIYINSRCKWHGGCSTGPKTEAGKQRSAMNGFCRKKAKSYRWIKL
ncbi:HGGxSTG domain-containing protein [Methylomonas methanica]|uniref:HGGxSTG domain-containing protein n=1 Tax=Methylomonas methanica TaxID=421 RepID=UPI003B02D360